MKIGILEAGALPIELEQKWGRYTRLYETMFATGGGAFTCTPYKIYENEFPQDHAAHDGWLITGSKHGAYEDHDWIPPLENLLRKLAAQKTPLVGVCFGHQILAQALGGKVIKSPKGWGLGPAQYNYTKLPNWLNRHQGEFSGNAVHQDQVIELPEQATVLASSDFCPNAVLAYGDPQAPDAISIQPHPEFENELVLDLLEIRRGETFDLASTDQAMARLTQPVDNTAWARQIVDFFKMAHHRNTAN